MTILHVIPTLQRGGAERALTTLIKATAGERKHAVLTLRDLGPYAQEIEATGTPVSTLGATTNRATLAVPFKLARHIRRYRPAIVQSWMYHADALSMLAIRQLPRSMRPRLVWNIRTTVADQNVLSRTARFARKLCARFSHVPDRIIVNSLAGKKIHSAIGYRSLVYIPNAIDGERFSQRLAGNSRLQGSRALKIGHVARVVPVKNHSMFIDIAGRQPEHQFIAVGKGTENLVGPANMRTLGARDDIPELLAGFDLLLVTSHHEGWPNVVGEAMACQTPVISTPVGDAAIVMGDTGWIARDADAFANQIDRFASMPLEDRRALGVKARERIMENYSIDRFASAFMRLYDSL